MQIPVNRFKAGLAANRPQIGLWSSLSSNIASEIVSLAGFDWIVLDAEHSPSNEIGMLSQLQAMAVSDASAIIRVAENDRVLIKRALDIGAQTIIVPQVESAEEAVAAVAATRYPPAGVRGVGPMARTSRYGTITDYLHRAGDQTCLIAMCETARGLQNLDAIARTPDVDGVLLGPQDLAADMGHLGDPSHPDVDAALTRAVEIIRGAGKPAGIMVGAAEEAARWLDAGCRFVGCSSDAALLRQSAQGLATRLRTASRDAAQ
jgi:4-hydroxy-2-oxoheptanedioate aldolase